MGVGDWVVLPSGQVGQVWCLGARKSAGRTLLWVADGQQYVLADVGDLVPANGGEHPGDYLALVDDEMEGA